MPKFVRITIDVELEKPDMNLNKLMAMVSGRAHTIEGVANAFDAWVEEIPSVAVFGAQARDRYLQDIHMIAEKVPSLWDRIKGWFYK